MLQHATLFAILLLPLACTDTAPGADGAAVDTTLTQAVPAVVKKVVPTLAPSGPGGPRSRGSLSPYFPHVVIETSTSFAHDRGDMTSLTSVTIGGKASDRAKILETIVAGWKGWTSKGGRSDEDVLRTTREYLVAMDMMLGVNRVDGKEPPARLASVLPGRAGLTYHPPRYEIREVAGERVVVATEFRRGHIDSRGQHWIYSVRAFRVKDGSGYVIAKDSPLPQHTQFTH